VNRRRALRLSVGVAAALLLGGHTPYGQWVVYRKKHLLIGCHKLDPETYDLAKRVVALLAEHLPAAQSRIARAPDAGRLASLLGTAQMAVAIVNSVDAEAMLGGTGRFEAYGAVSLRLLLPIAGRLLIARTDFPARQPCLAGHRCPGRNRVGARAPTGGRSRHPLASRQLDPPGRTAGTRR